LSLERKIKDQRSKIKDQKIAGFASSYKGSAGAISGHRADVHLLSALTLRDNAGQFQE
jgi:hypothetical protein